MKVPSYEQLDIELRPFRVEALDSKGKPFQYLSLEKKHEYLASKGVIKIVNKDVVLLQGLDGIFPYKEYENRIGVLQSKKKYIKVGQMGTDKVKEISADEINF